MKTTKQLLFLVLLFFILPACGQKISRTVEEYKEPFSQKREQLIEIAESLPPIGSVTENVRCINMDPPLVIKDRYPDYEYNGAMLMYDQLINPDLDLYDEVAFDVGIGHGFLRAIQWAGPENPMSELTMDNRSRTFETDLQEALAYEYLVVNRIQGYVPAQIFDESSFIPGLVSIEGFVVSLKTNEILCRYHVAAATTAETVSFNNSRSDGKSAESELQWALETDIRKAIQELLPELTGGEIQYSSLKD